MKSVITAIVLSVLFISVKAQSNDNKVYTAVEHQPEPPGGETKYLGYLTKNIRATDKKNDQQIKTKLVIEMIIEKDGSVSHLKVITGISPGIDKQAIAFIKKSAKWIPGKLHGKPVRTKYTMPIILEFQSE